MEICDEAFFSVRIEKADGRIYLPDTIMFIGKSAFEYACIDCVAGKKACFVLPSGIKKIGEEVFENIAYRWSKDGNFDRKPSKEGKA